MPKNFPQKIILGVYSWLGRLVLPLFLGRFLYRSFALPDYRKNLLERLGFSKLPPHAIWIHAVSLGETKAALPLLQRFLALGEKIALTHTTPTARKLAQKLLPQGSFAYLPFDDPLIIHCFLNRLQPKALIIMETELWPNLLWICQQKKIPVFLANARLSKKSARRYAYFRFLTRTLLPSVTIFAQSRKDAKRFQFLGATTIKVYGNLKFDIKPPPEAYEKARHFRSLIKNRFVLCIASTRLGEEEILLKNLTPLFSSIPKLLLLIVPRHPERFAEVEALLKKENYIYQKRSDEHPIADETKIWLGDSMGELYAYYGAADIAIIGGSFLDYGGQNPIEAMAMGIPVIIGPYTEHFSSIVRQALCKKALLQTQSPTELLPAIQLLYQDIDKRQQLCNRAFDFFEKGQGSTYKMMQGILTVLQQQKSSRL